MKIARIIESFPKKNTGGLVPNVYYLSKEQIRQGHEVEIFTFTDKATHQVKIDGLKINRIKKPPKIRIFGGWKMISHLKKINFKPDIVHGLQTIPYGWLFPFVSNQLKTKFVLSIHGTIFPFQKSKVKGLRTTIKTFEYSNLIQMLAKKMDLVLPIAPFIKKELLKIGVLESKIMVIPTGLNYDLFNQKRAKKNEKNDTFKILYVGRFAQTKGIPYLIEAFSLIKDKKAKMNLVGGKEEDNDYLKIKRLIQEKGLGNKIKLIKPVLHQELAKLYHGADVFVLPSILEPLGKVILEAQAAGVPVIATKQGGVADVISDQVNGLLVPPKNSKALAKAIVKLRNDPQLGLKISRKAFITSKQYDWKIIARKYSEAFSRII